jgi:hypothetical protein
MFLAMVSCFNRNNFPDDMTFQRGIFAGAKQVAVELDPFQVQQDGVSYTVEPRYKYDLTGLVVSYQNHDGESRLHRLWNDHLNVADICVVWDQNASTLDLNKFHFWNGQFTCFFSTSDNEEWRKFQSHQLSNNHLLSNEPDIRDEIETVRIGDQIRIRGWLANYTQASGFRRNTSDSRQDVGNGACETIYVKDFSVLQSMHSPWRVALNISLLGMLTIGVFGFMSVQRGYV